MKKLSNYDLIKITVTSAVGSGIIFSHKSFAEKCNSSLGIILIWIISGLITLVQSLCYAELASIISVGGGDASYLSYAFSEKLSILYNIFSCVAILPASSAICLKMICENYGIDNSILTTAIVFSTLVIIFAPKQIWRLILDIFFYLKIASLLFLAILIAFCDKNPFSFLKASFNNKISTKSFLSSLVNCTYFYAGYNSCNYMQGDMIGSLKKPYVMAVFIITGIYLYFSVGFMSIFSYASLLDSNSDIKYICTVIHAKYFEKYFTLSENLTNSINSIIKLSLYFGPVFGCHTVFEGIISTMIAKFGLHKIYKHAFLCLYGIIISRLLITGSSYKIFHYLSIFISGFYCLTFLSLLKLHKQSKLHISVPALAFSLSLFLTLYNGYHLLN